MTVQRSVSAYSFLKRDADRQRYEGQLAQTYTQIGKTLVVTGTTADESTVLVPFTNVFVEEPLFTFGSVLDPGSPAVAGSFPTASATVHKWSTIANGPSIVYQGAFLGMVTTGIAGQRIWIHYSFVGKALSFGLGTTPGNTTSTA